MIPLTKRLTQQPADSPLAGTFGTPYASKPPLMPRSSHLFRLLTGCAIGAIAFGWAGNALAARADGQLPHFRLTLRDELPMLRRYAQPSVETPSASWRFAWGPWGMTRWATASSYGLHLELAPAGLELADPTQPWAHAQWGLAHTRPWRIDAWSIQRTFGPTAPSFFGAANAPPTFWSFEGWKGLDASAPDCEPTVMRFTRYQSETDAFALIDCDGSVTSEAIDRLSVMARPPGVARPTLPLPDEPSTTAEPGAWLPSIRLLHPRLVWLVSRIGATYPNNGIYIVSGYRPDDGDGVHAQGRALDIQVMGVSKERLYRTCRRYRDVGCGYYPNHAFVHVDVRPSGTGSRYWVDVSEPGQPSEYVDSWPGVENGRGAVFDTSSAD